MKGEKILIGSQFGAIEEIERVRDFVKAPIAAETASRVVALACTEPPLEATHWTGRAMSKAIGISLG